MYVMAGLILADDGRVLLAERLPGKHLAGFWEFPGGKLEAGEQPLAALARELREELGIELQAARPLIRVPWTYDDRRLLLDAWCVERWQGMPQPLEGQALQWCLPAAIDPQNMTPADRPILQALRLPDIYGVTPTTMSLDQRDAWIARIAARFDSGLRLLRLSLPHWPVESVRLLARDLLPLAQASEAQLLLDGDIEGAQQLGIGVQLGIEQCAGLSQRPLPWRQLVGVRCRDASELAMATRLRADFSTLPSGVDRRDNATAHQQSAWASFQALAEDASLPVYAADAEGLPELDQARRSGAQGIEMSLMP